MTKKPNFLFFITDQQRADWLGCMGHPLVKTPNIDAIAAQGTRFSRFHVASPVCMPNRASLVTGRMPSVHGLRINGCRLPQSANTFVDVLAADGYDTATIGKSHLQPFAIDPPFSKKADADAPLVAQAWKPMQGNYENEQPASYAGTDPYDLPTPYYGYDHVDMLTRHGDACGGHYEQWFNANVPNAQALRDPANELAHDYTCPQAYRTPIPEEAYPTHWVADRAVDYLNDPRRKEAPFFAFVSFPDPHHPFNPPGKYWDMYNPDDFDVPLPYAAHKNPTPPLQWLKKSHEAGGGQLTKQTAFMAPDQHVREAMALTAGMITMIDDAMGRVIQALKDSGEYDNTVIVFNSDHGDYLGDFNLLLKGLMPSDAITRVPMIWSDPADRREATTNALASTIDIAPTILERAGLTPYAGMQGISMAPTLRGGTHRDEVLTEFNDGAGRFGFDDPARVRSLLTGKWRFTLYAGQDWGELYDLENDPRETRNLWDDPACLEVRSTLSMRMNHHLAQQMDETPLPDRLA